MLSHSYFPLIHYPTRVTDYSVTLIDNIFTNDLNYFSNTAIVISDLSDHFPVVIKYSSGQRDASEAHVRTVNHPVLSTSSLINKLSITDWSEIELECQTSNNSNLPFDNFMSLINEHLQSSYFNKTSNKSNKKVCKNKWMTKGLLNSCN